jgi:predicted ArsR family transcriptional regulator
LKKDHDVSTRKIILTLLKTRGLMSVGDLARELNITEMAVRRHIHTLERDGLLESQLSRQPMGRPTRLYGLSMPADDLFPKNYQQLALDLLGEMDAEEHGKAAVLFERRMQGMYAKYKNRMDGKNLPERVAELADIQDAGGYMVKWEQTEQGALVLHEYNCPITQVAAVYNEACRCELALFEKLLEADVERTDCLSKGGSRCTYRIQEKKA